jgi:hypothetical protein
VALHRCQNGGFELLLTLKREKQNPSLGSELGDESHHTSNTASTTLDDNLNEYVPDFHYSKGVENCAADALSCLVLTTDTDQKWLWTDVKNGLLELLFP